MPDGTVRQTHDGPHLEALGRLCRRHRAALLEAGREAGLLLEPAVERHGLSGEGRLNLSGAQLADEARGVPAVASCAAAERAGCGLIRMEDVWRTHHVVPLVSLLFSRSTMSLTPRFARL